jgi:hypothetical protein
MHECAEHDAGARREAKLETLVHARRRHIDRVRAGDGDDRRHGQQEVRQHSEIDHFE